MTSSFKLRFVFVFGLLVLYMFQPFSVEAQRFNLFPKRSPPNNVRQRPLPLPSSSTLQSIELQRPQRPMPSHSSALSSSNSLTTINLHSPSSSSSVSDIYQSAPMLNSGNSPAIMRETSTLHRQAASVLNLRGIGMARTHRENTMLQRLKPNPARLNLIGKYVKSVAIAVSGVGGVIVIANAFSNDSDEKKEIHDDDDYLTTTTTTPELSNQLGVDR